jgi:hypothetical protein
VRLKGCRFCIGLRSLVGAIERHGSVPSSVHSAVWPRKAPTCQRVGNDDWVLYVGQNVTKEKVKNVRSPLVDLPSGWTSVDIGE